MKINQNQIDILAGIKQEFCQFRKEFPGKNSFYPENLRRLVSHALEQGLTGRCIAEVAKITPNTVLTWKKSADKIEHKPKELKIVLSTPTVITTPKHENGKNSLNMSNNLLAKITLSSGVLLEISVTEQSAFFLKNLFELGVLS